MELIKLSREGFESFAKEANERSTLSMQDGLKPVHRRVLYTMKQLKATEHKGSSKIVGEALASYHPHGDSSVYDAAVRLSQDFKLRYPLIHLEGNGGSVINDEYAAMRYTKLKLTALGNSMLENIEKNTVPFVENFDGTTEEPVYLPSAFPNLICNGGLGIGVGLSTSMLPHNLREVASAICAYLDNSLITVEEIMGHIKGPDFPTGGIIIDTEKLKEIYAYGRGTVRLRAKHHIENVDGKVHIVITEIPYLVNIETKIIDKIKKLVVEEDYDQIYDIKNSTGDGKLEIRIILEKKANANRVLEYLFQKTGLEATIKINNTVNTGNGFTTYGIYQLINRYVLGQHNIIKRAAEYDLEKYNAKLNVLEGLIIALDNIDEVIAIIKASKNRSVAAESLTKRFGFNAEQTKAILDTKLSRLTTMEIDELKLEIAKYEALVEECNKRINNTQYRVQLIKERVMQLAKDFGDDRRTMLTFNTFEQTEVKDVYVILKKKGIETVPLDFVKTGNRGAKGNSIGKEDICDMVKARQNETIFCLSEEGECFAIPVNQINFNEEKNGELSLLEEISDFKGLPARLVRIDFEKEFLVTVTQNGVLKRTSIKEYKELKRSNVLCKIKDGDKLKNAFSVNKDEFIIMVLDNGKVSKILVDDIKETKRNTIGTKAIGANYVVSAAAAKDSDTLLIWEAGSNGKRIKCSEFSQGIVKNSGQACGDGEVVGVINIEGFNYITVVGEGNKSVTYEVAAVSERKIKASGSILYKGSIIKVLTL